MTVTPYQPNVLPTCHELHQFLLRCQQDAIRHQCPKLAHFACSVTEIDPLLALQDIVTANHTHFYFENARRQEAIAAIGSVAYFEPRGTHRFDTAQQFIQSWFQHSHTFFANDTDLEPDLDPDLEPDRTKLGSLTAFCGFTFFDQPQSPSLSVPRSVLLIPRWQVSRQGDRATIAANVIIAPTTNLTQLAHSLWQKLQSLHASCQTEAIAPLPDPSLRITSINHQRFLTETHPIHHFKTAVSAALNTIQSQQLDKVVLAHTVNVERTQPFSTAQCLQNLRRLHPDCYLFSTGNGNGQCFIGASPERLLSIRQNQLVVDALAGSAPRGNTRSRDQDLAQQLLTSDKERQEHQVVLDFIVDRLRSLGLTPQFATRPDLLRLANIQHLHTPIQAALSQQLHPFDILAALHPTPAVAGFPREAACQEIRRHEPFERSLYAAPLGWIDTQGNSEFIVGIRSALLEGHHAQLYAGAGIVAGSDPDREAAEIQLKLQALLNALA